MMTMAPKLLQHALPSWDLFWRGSRRLQLILVSGTDQWTQLVFCKVSTSYINTVVEGKIVAFVTLDSGGRRKAQFKGRPGGLENGHSYAQSAIFVLP
jgi:hypothetical protein